MNSTIEIHDSSGQVWFIHQSTIVGVNVAPRVMQIYVKGIPLPIALDIHADKQPKAHDIARRLMRREYGHGSRIISETVPS